MIWAVVILWLLNISSRNTFHLSSMLWKRKKTKGIIVTSGFLHISPAVRFLCRFWRKVFKVLVEKNISKITEILNGDLWFSAHLVFFLQPLRNILEFFFPCSYIIHLFFFFSLKIIAHTLKMHDRDQVYSISWNRRDMGICKGPFTAFDVLLMLGVNGTKAWFQNSNIMEHNQAINQIV